MGEKESQFLDLRDAVRERDGGGRKGREERKMGVRRKNAKRVRERERERRREEGERKRKTKGREEWVRPETVTGCRGELLHLGEGEGGGKRGEIIT